jgi:hypothetical protein
MPNHQSLHRCTELVERTTDELRWAIDAGEDALNQGDLEQRHLAMIQRLRRQADEVAHELKVWKEQNAEIQAKARH